MSSLIYWIWLTTRKGIGATTALRLLDRFVTPQRIYGAQDDEYETMEGLSPFIRKELSDKSLDEANDILSRCDALDIQIMTIQDANYPERLRQLDDPPLVLYYKGKNIRFDQNVVVGMVGARKATGYGMMAAGQLALEIARGGGIVVSGMAEGIDAACIHGALKGGGAVVSVLAGGIDKVFPSEHRFLYRDVSLAGMLISEYPPGTPHNGAHFPVRNRIISGLSLGVVAVECLVQSGTMITVRRALDQNRDVFAVAGNIDAPMSRGPNKLIQQGAKLVTCGEDILEEYRAQFPNRVSGRTALSEQVREERLRDLPAPKEARATTDEKSSKEVECVAPSRTYLTVAMQQEQFTDDEITVLRGLGNQNRTPDDLVEETQLPTRRVLAALTMLQVRGQVDEPTPKRFCALVELEPI